MTIEVLNPNILRPGDPTDRMSVASQVAGLIKEVYCIADPQTLYGKLGDLTFIDIEREGEIRGLVSVSWRSPLKKPPLSTAWLNILAVSPSARKLGTGSLLTDRAVTTIEKEGFEAIGLASAPGSETFWRNRGFVPCEPQPPDAHCMNTVMYRFL